jgi:hypothetical protein
MICQKCKKEEATVHISGTRTMRPFSGRESNSEDLEFHFCASCAEEDRHARSAHTLFPHLHEEHQTETLRVMSRTPQHTVLRVVRTEEGTAAEEWTLLTSRLPDRLQVGQEITVSFTPAELEWMRGEREL